MGCSTCAVNDKGSPGGCQNKGHCSSGTCNKLNSYDWFSVKEIKDPLFYDYVEISYKKGSRKSFVKNPTDASTGDLVVVDVGNGYDTGRISLSGELVRLQMKKKNFTEDRVMSHVVRLANERDMEKLHEARNSEKNTLIKARAIARTLDIDLKIGDVEYRGDKRKATFYFTSEGRVDFRELVRAYAKEFKVKIEMRQIGSRQESAKIGGVGSCGRELCCSTWLSDFKSVTSIAVRYQNLSINQAKLSGQCGRLKCCLNYELDVYVEAVRKFPEKSDELLTKYGKAVLVKTDIFKNLMHYSYLTAKGRSVPIALAPERVEKILKMNKRGDHPEELRDREQIRQEAALAEIDFADDVTGVIELPKEQKRRKKRRPKRRPNAKNKRPNSNNPKAKEASGGGTQNSGKNKSKSSRTKSRPNRGPKNQNSKNKNQNQNKPNKDK